MKKFFNIFLTSVLISQVSFFGFGQTPLFDWAIQLGGTSQDYGNGLVIDNQGYLVCMGVFSGVADFDPGPGISNLVSSTGNDVFVAKYDPLGNHIWSRAVGGPGSQIGNSIGIDNEKNIFFAGTFYDTMDADPGPGIFNLISNSANLNSFIICLDSSGNFKWAGKISSSSNVGLSNISISDSGFVYSTGYFQGTADFDPGGGTSTITSSGGRDVFLSKWSNLGNFLWAKNFGGTLEDNGLDIEINELGNPVLIGDFQGVADFDPGTSSFNLTSFGGKDLFVAQLNPSGGLIWAKQIGGLFSGENAYCVTTSLNNDILIGGKYSGVIDFDPGPGVFNLPSMGGYLLKLDNNGSFDWAKGFDGFNTFVRDVKIDLIGNFISTGYFFQNVDFDPGPGIFNLTATVGSSSAADVFISKLDSAGNFVWAQNFGGGNVDEGKSLELDNNGNIFISGRFGLGTSDFDFGQGVFNLTSFGSYDAFIHKTKICFPISVGGIQVQDISCFFGNDGVLIGNSSGGFTPYEYSIDGSNFSLDSILSGLSAGDYKIYIRDANGCLDSSSTINIPEPQSIIPPICLVTVDSTSSYNVVVWEEPITAIIDSFFIYRESIGVYEKVGKVAFADTSYFTDLAININPNIQSYKYKISALDTCGGESDSSSYHKTLHVQTSFGVGNEVLINWDPYEGFSFPIYEVHRSVNGSPFMLWQNVSIGNTQITDPNPPPGVVSYRVEIVPPNFCLSNVQIGKTFDRSRSNADSKTVISSFNINSNNEYKIYPNPVKDKLTIDFKSEEEVKYIQLLDALGTIVIYEEIGYALDKHEMNVSTLAQGWYVIQVKTENEIYSTTIIR